MTLNRLTLIGFVGADAEEKTNSKASPYTVFSVATNSSWKNEDGEMHLNPHGTGAWPTANSPASL
jgi:single-stranded DNA-binding protein